jgi:hypothetical protein
MLQRQPSRTNNENDLIRDSIATTTVVQYSAE